MQAEADVYNNAANCGDIINISHVQSLHPGQHRYSREDNSAHQT